MGHKSYLGSWVTRNAAVVLLLPGPGDPGRTLSLWTGRIARSLLDKYSIYRCNHRLFTFASAPEGYSPGPSHPYPIPPFQKDRSVFSRNVSWAHRSPSDPLRRRLSLLVPISHSFRCVASAPISFPGLSPRYSLATSPPLSQWQIPEGSYKNCREGVDFYCLMYHVKSVGMILHRLLLSVSFRERHSLARFDPNGDTHIVNRRLMSRNSLSDDSLTEFCLAFGLAACYVVYPWNQLFLPPSVWPRAICYLVRLVCFREIC